jgi:adenine/guanine phosphoribosyltransferase-like PRPP-binding protein
MPRDSAPVHALVLDDTWTTGARAQSLAYALKKAGAASVAVVVLGRHIRPEHEPSRQLLRTIKDPLFDIATCAVESMA